MTKQIENKRNVTVHLESTQLFIRIVFKIWFNSDKVTVMENVNIWGEITINTHNVAFIVIMINTTTFISLNKVKHALV